MAVTGQNYEGLKVSEGKTSPTRVQNDLLDVSIKHGWNVDLCTTEENYFNFQGFFHHVGVPFVTKTQHYKLTKDVVNRVVWAKWISQRSKILADSSSLDLDSQQDVSSQKQELFSQERAARGEQIVCLGDARHDSPGFTACWCTYAVLVCKLQLYGPMYTIVHNIFTGCCNWTGRLLLDSAQRPGNLKLKYVNHLAVYIRWDRVRPWSQRVLRPP